MVLVVVLLLLVTVVGITVEEKILKLNTCFIGAYNNITKAQIKLIVTQWVCNGTTDNFLLEFCCLFVTNRSTHTKTLIHNHYVVMVHFVIHIKLHTYIIL